MSGRIQAFLKTLEDPGQFVRVPDRVIFDAHAEVGRDGKVLRDFKRQELEEIANYCNRRDQTGTLSPLTLGHTNPDEEDERKQPEIVGYARGYKVEYDPELKKFVIKTNFYLKKEDYERAKTYPRTSIELWPPRRDRNGKLIDPPIIDPIALLRRAPKQDLGVWTYARGDPRRPAGAYICYRRAGRVTLRYSLGAWTTQENEMATTNGRQPAAHYQMDEELEEKELHSDDAEPTPEAEDEAEQFGMDDEAPPAEGEAGPSPEEHMEFAKHCASHPLAGKLSAHYAKMAEEPPAEEPPMSDPTAPPDVEAEPGQYGAMAMPSATNAFPARHQKGKPGKPAQGKASATPGTSRYRKGGDPLLCKRIEELEKSRAADREEAAQREAQAKAENWALVLEQEGYELDEDAEEGDVPLLARAYRKGGDAACEKVANKIRQYRKERLDHPVGQVIRGPQRAPGGTGRVVDLESDPEAMPPEDQARVVAYQRKTRDYDSDWATLAAKALPEKYGRNGTAN